MPMCKESELNYVISAEQVLACDTLQKPNASVQSELTTWSTEQVSAAHPESLTRNRRLQSQSSVCSSVDFDCGFCAIQEQMQQQQFAQQMLERHNQLRVRHQVPPLTLNQNLATYAKDWVEIIARNDRLERRSNSRHGENIFGMCLPTEHSLPHGRVPVDFWYSASKDYDYTRAQPSSTTAFFTQLVWKSSKFVGFAWARSKSNRLYVVANYSLSGNFPRQYLTNVLPPLPGSLSSTDSDENE